jgi:hypothetical protein
MGPFFQGPRVNYASRTRAAAIRPSSARGAMNNGDVAG